MKNLLNLRLIRPMIVFALRRKPENELCMSSRPVRFLTLVACAVAGGCADHTPAVVGNNEPQATAATFAETFVLRDSVLLEQPDSAPIVRISGIDRDEDGRILIGDVSEGNVKLFASDGRLLRVIGRKGHGPGEFSAPRYPRFGADGLIYVADAQDPRIQVFDSAGTLLRATRLTGVGVVMGFHPVTPERHLLVVQRESDDHVLLEVDSAGKELRRFLAIGEVKPTGQRDFRLWRNVRAFFLTVAGDTVYVSSTLSDSLWTVHLPTGAEARTRLRFAGYRVPSPPDRDPEGIEGLMTWNRSFHAGSTLSTDAGTLYLPYVQGVLNDGDPMLLLTRIGTRWKAVNGAPPIIGAGGGSAMGLLTPKSEQVRLGLFVPRGNP